MAGNKILLTGAGFSHNFNLPLARHVWAIIFNDPKIQKVSTIRTKMLQNYDYESLYSSILTKSIDDNERIVFLEKIDNVFNETFEELCIKPFLNSIEFGISLHDLRNFISFFRKKRDGFLFTLNQDLFIERLFLNSTIGLTCPFIGNPLINYNSSINPDDKLFAKNISYKYLRNYEPRWQGKECIMPTEDKLIEEKANLGSRSYDHIDYFKLHGSIAWKDEEKNIPIIMGTQKKDLINSLPLLREYLERFNEALSVPDSSLLTIGYGYADTHINNCIFDAIEKYGLKLHILAPEPLMNFKEKLLKISNINQNHVDKIIHKGIYGYYETTLRKVFPYNPELSENKNIDIDGEGIRSQSLIWEQIKSNFLNI